MYHDRNSKYVNIRVRVYKSVGTSLPEYYGILYMVGCSSHGNMEMFVIMVTNCAGPCSVMANQSIIVLSLFWRNIWQQDFTDISHVFMLLMIPSYRERRLKNDHVVPILLRLAPPPKSDFSSPGVITTVLSSLQEWTRKVILKANIIG